MLFHRHIRYLARRIPESRVAWFTITGTSVPVRGGFHQMHSQYVEQAVIPRMPNEVRDELAALTNNAQSAAQERLRLQQALLRRLPDLCPPDRQPKLTTKLQEWWTLPDFAAFRAEIKKTFKAEIPLAERSDWEDWINRDRVQINRLTAEMAQAEARRQPRLQAVRAIRRRNRTPGSSDRDPLIEKAMPLGPPNTVRAAFSLARPLLSRGGSGRVRPAVVARPQKESQSLPVHHPY